MTLIAVETISTYDAQSQINIAKKELNIIREEEEEKDQEKEEDEDSESKSRSECEQRMETPLKSEGSKSVSS